MSIYMPTQDTLTFELTCSYGSIFRRRLSIVKSSSFDAIKKYYNDIPDRNKTCTLHEHILLYDPVRGYIWEKHKLDNRVLSLPM